MDRIKEIEERVKADSAQPEYSVADQAQAIVDRADLLSQLAAVTAERDRIAADNLQRLLEVVHERDAALAERAAIPADCVVVPKEDLETLRQTIYEVRHAHEQGPWWYTKGESALRSHVRVWLDKAHAADCCIAAAIRAEASQEKKS